MGFFTIGNIITLCIVLLVLVLYRQMDRGNRTLKRLRDYSEKLKKELDDFVKEQEKAVKDYSISLNVERDSARELMKRLQLTEEELAKKAQAVNMIENKIKSYEGSLSELDNMTGRVQENMNRVRDESAFVEEAGKRIGEVKSRLVELEKGLGNLESRFERENAESLAETADAVVSDVKSLVSDLRAAAETIERKVEDHREAVDKLEETRAANMARDTEYINKILSKAVEQAGRRADKMEEAALVSLKEQAEDRILKIKTTEEEKLRNYHENARTRVAEVQALIKNFREE
jgi:chromosome segregation ATPase